MSLCFVCNIEQFDEMPNDINTLRLTCYSDPHRRASRIFWSKDTSSLVREGQDKSGMKA